MIDFHPHSFMIEHKLGVALDWSEDFERNQLMYDVNDDDDDVHVLD